MRNYLSFRGLLVITIVIAVVTGFLTWIVIDFEPPAFVGFFFGAICGALWLNLVVLARDYLEVHS